MSIVLGASLINIFFGDFTNTNYQRVKILNGLTIE